MPSANSIYQHHGNANFFGAGFSGDPNLENKLDAMNHQFQGIL